MDNNPNLPTPPQPVEPPNTSQAVQEAKKTQAVHDIKRAIREGQVPDEAVPAGQRPHDSQTQEALLHLYLEKRVDGQLKFYESRINEYEGNVGFMVSMGALIMALSAFISAIGTTYNSPFLALTTALLPAVAAVVASMRQLYQWEKQSALYRDARLGLEEAKLLMPDLDLFDKRTAPVIFPRLVAATEGVFTAEINQWGQIALGEDEEGEDALNQALRELAAEERIAGASGANYNDGGVG